jgi:hypothetical protein
MTTVCGHGNDAIAECKHDAGKMSEGEQVSMQVPAVQPGLSPQITLPSSSFYRSLQGCVKAACLHISASHGYVPGDESLLFSAD